ncbi:MAG: hypothetical protein CYPHOPRED_001673 [Cyphobasidiales sp. Tagirdzhanova-0007]|nr:MAG: hypothetical protein CYPHOPRED_001673 [Cyphobasidiales sp. Tagirdzhanova-0007]
MGFFSDDSNEAQAYNDNRPKFTHELIGGAAAYEAERKYQQHCAENGQPENHEMAKDLMAGFAGAEADRLIETKGLDFIDNERAKRSAQDSIDNNVTQDAFNNY